MTTTPLLALIWRPFFPVVPTLTFVAVLLGLVVFVCVRCFGHQPGLSILTGIMRTVFVVAGGVLLLGPSTVGPEESGTEKPRLTVLLDTSASMQTMDADGMSRFRFATERWLGPSRLASLRSDYVVELSAFDETVRAISEETLRLPANRAASAGVTNLAESVGGAVSKLGNIDGSAILLISDGRDTLSQPMHPVGQLAGSASIPIYSVALGGPNLTRDLALMAVPNQPYLFVNEPGTLSVRVVQSNAGHSQTRLHVKQGDTQRSYPVVFDGASSVTIEVPIQQARAGHYEYRVWVDPIPGEVERSNNTQPVFMEVTAKRLRILILEGMPYWDTKFLAQSLRKDSRIELTQITQVSPKKRETLVSQDGAKTRVPQTLDGLAYYDVIILGRGIENILDLHTASLLPEYVSEHGGRLVFSRGRAYDPDTPTGQNFADALSVIEPVVFGEGVLHNQPIVPEPAGLIHPSLRPGEFPPVLMHLSVIQKEKAATKVLARTRPSGAAGHSGSGQPAIVTMPYNRGVVLAVLGEGLWKWGLHSRREDLPASPFDRFWSDMTRWLALDSDYQPGKPVSLRLSRNSVGVGEPISVDLISRIALDQLDARVYAEGPGGVPIELAPKAIAGKTNRHRVTLNPDAPGEYRVVVQTPLSAGRPIEARFYCYDVDLERLQSAADPQAMRILSELSGGRCLRPDAPDGLPKLLRSHRASIRIPPRPYYLWGRGWVMAMVLCWTGGEWIIRRKAGLL